MNTINKRTKSENKSKLNDVEKRLLPALTYESRPSKFKNDKAFKNMSFRDEDIRHILSSKRFFKKRSSEMKYVAQSGEDGEYFNLRKYIYGLISPHTENFIQTRVDEMKNFKTDGFPDSLDFTFKLIEDVYVFIHMLQPNLKPKFNEDPNEPTLVTEGEQLLLDQDSFKRRLTRAIMIFIKLRFNSSLVKALSDKIVPFVLRIFQNETGELEPQSGFDDVLTGLRGSLDSFSAVKHSPIFTKLYKCCMYLMSFSLFEAVGITMDTFGYNNIEQALLKKKYSEKTDFIYTLADTLLFIVERGYQIYVTGDVTTIFHSGGTYKAMYELSVVLKRQFNLLNNPEDHGFTESGFRSDLDNLIEKLQSVAKHSYRLCKNDKLSIQNLLSDMLMMRDDLNTQSAARKERKAPFSILLFGDSGIGKTTLTTIIRTYFAKIEGLPTGSEFVFTRNPSANYWDGFRSSCHTIVLDDIANEDPKMQNMESVNEVIQLINNCAFCPDQASLENKGKTPMRAKLVIGTTNVKTLNTYHYFSVPSAVQRRFPYIITPTVRPEFLDSRGMLNSSMVPDLGPYPDLWTFKVELVKPVPVARGKSLAEIEIVKEDLDMKGFLIWMKSAIDKFNRDQNQVQKCLDEMVDTKVCVFCSLPEPLCTCTIQSGLSYNEAFWLITPLYTFVIGFILYCHSTKIFQTLNFLAEYFRYYKQKKSVWEYRKKQMRDALGSSKTWEAMGNRMMTTMKHPVFFVAIASVVGSLYLFYRRAKNLIPQVGLSDQVGVRPSAEFNSRENVWYNNTLDLSPANFTRESASSRSMQFTDFCKKMSDNVIRFAIEVKNKNVSKTGKAICLGGHIYITNNHNIPELDKSTINIVVGLSKGITSNVTTILTEADVVRIPEKDMAILLLREVPPRKRIVQYFQSGNSNGVFNGKYVSRSKDGGILYRDVQNIKLGESKTYTFSEPPINATNQLWSGRTKEPTEYGDCGSPLIIESPYGYSIVGMHFLADKNDQSQVYASSINGDFVRELYASLTPYNIGSGCLDLLSSTSSVRTLTDLHKKSPLRYIQSGNAEVYGSFTGFRGKPTTSVTDTPMQKLLDPFEYPVKYTKPEMASWVPWHIALKDLVDPIHTLETSVLNECISNYVETVNTRINARDVSEMLQVYDNFTAINGAEVTYVDKLNRNTSAGNPWKKSKKYFLTSIEPMHGMQDPVEVSEEIMDRVDIMIETYLSGDRVNPNFCAHLKDEPVSFEKASIGKTRVFTGAPFDWIIVVRKYLLSFSRLMQNNKYAFEAGPGVVVQSLEWQEMFNYVTMYGESNIIAGDYKAFDKKMSPKEILAAFDVIIHFCRESGNYTLDDLKVIQGIAEDTAFAIVDYNGDLIQLFGSNPSGNPLTVILNGIVNSLRMRYVYKELSPTSSCADFHENVALMTYGDDNICSRSDNCQWFNHTTISSKFAELGIVYTMADKTAESIPLIHIKDASFLKRTWRMDDDLNCYMAPLDHDSIERMLTVWVRSKVITVECQGIAVISTALREYFFYGRDIFEKKRLMFIKLVNDLGWEAWVEESTFPSYEFLRDQFVDSSKNCILYEDYFSEYKRKTGDHCLPLDKDVGIVLQHTRSGDSNSQVKHLCPQGFSQITDVQVQKNGGMAAYGCKRSKEVKLWDNRKQPMCNEYYQKQTQQQELSYRQTQNSDKEQIFSPQEIVEIDQIKQQLRDIYFSDCECEGTYICEACDFVDNLESTLQLDNFDVLKFITTPTPRNKHFPTSVFNNVLNIFGEDHYVVQSGFQQQNVNFNDSNEGNSTIMRHDISYTKPDKSWAANLGDFLSRPVKIHSFVWEEGNTMTEGIEPWHLYFNSTPIKNKLNNYYLLRCNLHIKVVINASPFYYGSALVSYRPLTNLTSDNYNPCRVLTSSGNPDVFIMGRSQRPHGFIYPQSSEGTNLLLPFMYHKNWLNATSSVDLREMGALHFDSMTSLLNANSTVGTDVTVQVYAWTEDLELAGPTNDLAVQSGDEYSNGVVSKPASAIARVTSSLSQIPVIGPFMTATSFAAGAVANIAKLFGYTNVPNIAPVSAMINKPYPNMATTDISTPIEKLTLDSKNELTIDPKVCGCDHEDELVISKIATRESYITKFNWEATDLADALLFNILVLPTYTNIGVDGTQTMVQGTPSFVINQLFYYWRGDIKLRFKFVCTKYHRGRVRISWDPVDSIQSVADTTTTSYTKIVDITDADDIELIVPYTQPYAYLKTMPQPHLITQFDSAAITSQPDYSNGILTVRVLTQQSSPEVNAVIPVMVFASCVDNIEFAEPIDIIHNYSPFLVQSGEDKKDDVQTEMMAVSESTADNNINLMYMGEVVRSLRQVMRRAAYHRTYQAPTAVATNNLYNFNTSQFRRLPLYPGYDPNGIHTANNTYAAGTSPYNYVNWIPLTWVSQCFVGNRGSVIYNVNVTVSCTSNVVTRSRETLNLSDYRFTTSSFSPSTGSAISFTSLAVNPQGTAGFALTNGLTQTGMNVLAPMYSNVKFLANDYDTRTLGSTADGTTTDSLKHVFMVIGSANTNVKADFYSSIGTDYNPVMFLNMPTLYLQSTIPLPA